MRLYGLMANLPASRLQVSVWGKMWINGLDVEDKVATYLACAGVVKNVERRVGTSHLRSVGKAHPTVGFRQLERPCCRRCF